MNRRIWQWSSRLWSDSLEAGASLRPVLRTPGGLRRWLWSARAAQIALAISVVVGLWIMPPIRDTVTGWLFPSRTRAGFLGLSHRVRRHPWREPSRTLITTVYWSGASMLVLMLFWLNLPRTRQRLGSEELVSADHIEKEDSGSAGPAPANPAASAQTIAAPTGPGGAVAASGQGPRGPGALISGRYRLEEELGRGGMGVVYRAHDQLLGRDVALKALPRELVSMQELDQRFQQEARALAQLTHAHIVQIYDLMLEADGRWMAMELVSGGSLEQRIARGALEPDLLLRLAGQMAEALAYSHEQGVVHRDFKPANVLLTERLDAKVTDFGLAKLVGHASTLTQAGAIMGSPGYMSPEQASGKPVGPSSDAYSFGVTLYHMASGRLPFEGDISQLLLQHITQPPPPPQIHHANLSGPLEALIMRLLAKEPMARGSSMRRVAGELAELARQSSPALG